MEKFFSPGKEAPDALEDDISAEDLKDIRKTLDKKLIGDARMKKYYGENLLYGKEHLYSKYNALTTFFRSMETIGIASIVFHLPAFFLSWCLWRMPESQKYSFIFSFFISLGILLVSRRGRSRFEKKRDRAFLTDLYILLSDDVDNLKL